MPNRLEIEGIKRPSPKVVDPQSALLGLVAGVLVTLALVALLRSPDAKESEATSPPTTTYSTSILPATTQPDAVMAVGWSASEVEADVLLAIQDLAIAKPEVAVSTSASDQDGGFLTVVISGSVATVSDRMEVKEAIISVPGVALLINNVEITE